MALGHATAACFATHAAAQVARLVLEVMVAPSLLLITHVCVVQSQEEGYVLSGGQAGRLVGEVQRG